MANEIERVFIIVDQLRLLSISPFKFLLILLLQKFNLLIFIGFIEYTNETTVLLTEQRFV